ncbi:squalene synthase HpnC [Undibacterium sp. Ji22W]|uniref:squalene synthase HpnC n=1 Tax=Undibacterium sp. Ji22W TaxID=3413038 RepID=UPI003BF31A33
MSKEHYENFPVASWLMPAHLRPAVKTIYAFARSADDIADEGNASDTERLFALSHYESQLQLIQEQSIQETKLDPLFCELSVIIRQFNLPIAHFFDLISAFKQDVACKEYEDFSGLLNYCNRSANPVGRMMLHLYQADTTENLIQSDWICTALQLINFWQDVAIDWRKSRVYLPQEDLRSFQIDDTQIASGICNEAWRKMMQFQIDRARAMMIAGSPLCKRLPGRLGFELRLVVQGGLRILEKIEQINMDVFLQRPTIKSTDAWRLFWRAARM